MAYQCSKQYGAEQGLSACFRQWRATSHCNRLHGYALAITIVFQADQLDGRNWVVDFGALKPLKEQLVNLFDHKTVVAFDDPMLEHFTDMHAAGLIEMRQLPAVGCEAFAATVFAMAEVWLREYIAGLKEAGIPQATGLRVFAVEVREHAGNAAIYR